MTRKFETAVQKAMARLRRAEDPAQRITAASLLDSIVKNAPTPHLAMVGQRMLEDQARLWVRMLCSLPMSLGAGVAEMRRVWSQTPPRKRAAMFRELERHLHRREVTEVVLALDHLRPRHGTTNAQPELPESYWPPLARSFGLRLEGNLLHRLAEYELCLRPSHVRLRSMPELLAQTNINGETPVVQAVLEGNLSHVASLAAVYGPASKLPPHHAVDYPGYEGVCHLAEHGSRGCITCIAAVQELLRWSAVNRFGRASIQPFLSGWGVSGGLVSEAARASRASIPSWPSGAFYPVPHDVGCSYRFTLDRALIGETGRVRLLKLDDRTALHLRVVPSLFGLRWRPFYVDPARRMEGFLLDHTIRAGVSLIHLEGDPDIPPTDFTTTTSPSEIIRSWILVAIRNSRARGVELPGCEGLVSPDRLFARVSQILETALEPALRAAVLESVQAHLPRLEEAFVKTSSEFPGMARRAIVEWRRLFALLGPQYMPSPLIIEYLI
jgi:hypothetical protein